MRTQTGNQKGFSLIELMVVVGIIGILAAIAVPNYQRFQAKSRQTEAKSNLSGLYTAEKAFYAEWNLFFADFRDVGYTPEGTLRYHVGFVNAGTQIPANSGYSGPSNPTNPLAATTATLYNSTSYCPTTTGQASVCRASAFAQPVTSGSVTNSGQRFIAQARGNIDSDATIDTWQITEGKVITNPTPDVAQ